MIGNGFQDKLERARAASGSLLCLGLDPDLERIPSSCGKGTAAIEQFCHAIVQATKTLVCAYKPNMAFFEAHGPEGLRVLEKVLDKIPADIPVILDAKRGDIGNTSAFFAKALFEYFGADAATVNPLMGRDSVQPFADYTDKGVFLLCATSNPGAEDFLLRDGLYGNIAAMGAELHRKNSGVGLVVGATRPAMFGEIRKLFPMGTLLVPGVGAQGGDARSILSAAGQDIVINVSRSILYADAGSHFDESAHKGLLQLNAQIDAARKAHE